MGQLPDAIKGCDYGYVLQGMVHQIARALLSDNLGSWHSGRVRLSLLLPGGMIATWRQINLFLFLAISTNHDAGWVGCIEPVSAGLASG